jgi:cellulose synthase/poly-beta-1,6-N-acetylglucosamine synthase-like glycosyltransferase
MIFLVMKRKDGYNEAADKNSNPKVVVIFVTKNEDNTIENSITIAKTIYYKPEVLVVDAYSTDKARFWRYQ